ncbi:hypothetical protein LNKW23_32370 [Paralimibaculum aggregatum]|uniref:PepSY domain-containing protein n=1 Tax=Paralimibaculum aggregatum TaxID=3036245 RepID=A0ABQ6LRB6_9RHOB|nr:DUF6522 family protein [Limibaculum sp. NKW23]GMG84023.1 hypothetical protein LNKW23_32370 [Limibaculum sp. NKW23]
MASVAREGADFTVEAELLAGFFGLEPAAVPRMMRSGAITSRSERGIGEDEGRWRLTFYHGGRALRLVVDAEGTVLRRSSFDTGPRAGTKDGRAPG